MQPWVEGRGHSSHRDPGFMWERMVDGKRQSHKQVSRRWAAGDFLRNGDTRIEERCCHSQIQHGERTKSRILQRSRPAYKISRNVT